MAFALVQEGTLTGVTNINCANWNIVRAVNVADVSNGATATPHKEHETGRYSDVLMGSGWFYTGAAYPKPIEVTHSNGLLGCLSRAQLTFERMLTNTTCASTPQGQSDFAVGKTRLSGRLFGYLEDDETPLETGTIALTGLVIPFSTTHNVTGNAKIRRATYQNNARDGGGLGVPYDVVFTGSVTYNGSGNFLGSSTTPVSSFTADLALDNGQFWDGSVVAQRISCVVDYLRGLPTVANFVLPFNGAVDRDGSNG